MPKFKVKSLNLRYYSMYLRIFLTNFLSVILVTFIVTTLLYYRFEHTGLRLITDNNKKVLSQISYSVDYLNSSSKNFLTELAVHNDFLPLIYENANSLEYITTQIRELQKKVEREPKIYSAYVYNFSSETVYSSKYGIVDSSRQVPYNELKKLLDRPEAKRNYAIIPRRLKTTDYKDDPSNNKYINVYTYILYDSLEPADSKGAFIIDVKVDFISQTIKATNLKNMDIQQNNIFIINEEGKIMVDISAGNFLKDASEEKYVLKLLKKDVSEDSFIDDVQNKKHIITYVPTSIKGWKLICITPYSYLVKDIAALRLFIIYICIILFFVVLLCSFFLSKKIYSPIGNLVFKAFSLTKKRNEALGKVNEIDFISTALTDTLDKINKLEETNRNSASIVVSNKIKQLLLGHTSVIDAKTAAILKNYQIAVDFNDTTLVYILKIDRYKSFLDKYDDEGRCLMRFAISNIAEDITSKTFNCKAVDMGNDHIAVILNPVDLLQGDPMQVVEDLIREVQENTQKYLSLSVTASIGCTAYTPRELAGSYNLALRISVYRFFLGHNSLLYPQTLSARENNHFVLPVKSIEGILDSLKLGKSEQLSSQLNEFITSISDTSYDNSNISIVFLLFSLHNAINVINSNSSNKITIDFASLVKEISEIETIGQAYSRLNELLMEVSVRLEELKGKKTDIIVTKMIDMINSNYSDCNLSLEGVAGVLKMSPVYLGRLFKDYTSKAFSEYLMEVRLEESKQLLVSTNYNIEKILGAIGMNNASYFHKMFKKAYGVTPNEFRKVH